ncbi:MAG: hypothetical protein WAS33_30680 [Candidatus Promineifilaceae bacterium]
MDSLWGATYDDAYQNLCQRETSWADLKHPGKRPFAKRLQI